MRAFLTGASGFIGARVLDALVALGDEVRVLALPQTVSRLGHRAVIEVVSGDMSNPATLLAALHDVEVVYHLAGAVPPAPSAEIVRLNVQGTRNVLQASQAARVRRFVYVSSTAVYDQGHRPVAFPLTEDHPRGVSVGGEWGAYGGSKIAAEDAVIECHQVSGMEYVILRPPVTYGAGARMTRPLLKQVLDQPWPALSPTAHVVDMQWVHVTDLATAIVLAGHRPGAANATFNVAGREAFSMADVHSLVWQLVRSANGHHVASLQITDGLSSAWRYDIRRAVRTLGYAPAMTLRQGLRELLESVDLLAAP